MAAYAALASLSQTTHLSINKHKSLFFIGAEEKIRSIHEYVIFLLSFLQDFPEKANRWEGKMRDVAHETEDIIEEFMWQHSYSRWIKPSEAIFEEQLRNVTQKFCLMAGDLMDERPSYSPLHLAVSSSSSRAAPTDNAGVVGLADDLMAIKDRLCGLSSKLQVIPILGMGGIGKTTLARTVYDDPLIMYHFHIRVWLTISQDYNAKKILLGVLDSIKLIEQQMCKGALDSKRLREDQMCREETDDFAIAEKVYKNLKGRRYLIVMDDVWGTKVWDDVRNIFPDDNNGSRIMLTTRLADLAAYPGSNSPYEMRFMNDSQSWDLLKGKVFANRNFPSELEDVGKKIARSCGGLPLAVVLVAGFLCAVNKNLFSWEEISKNVNPVVGQELERILSLSYTHLPHHLRSCFLFIGMFPEDENIHASRLIRLWLAEGFLKHQNGCSKSLEEEEAEEYLEDLVKRNLVIVNSRKSNGKIKCCSLHDMVRDLCIRKARDEKFLCVMDGLVPQGMINERRISYKLSDIDDIWCPTIHTMLCFQIRSFPSSPAFLRRSRLLRILEVVGDKRKELPSQVFELFHLRYLTLICSSNIPSAISNLVNLQTLIILPVNSYKWKLRRRSGRVVSHFYLPLEMWGMQQLRHLILHAPCTLPHPPDGSNLPLENLQTLFYIKDLVWTKKILQMIPNLRRLGLVYESKKEFNLHLLKHLDQLEKLELYGLGDFSWMGHNTSTFPRTLKKLTLVGGEFPWEHMIIIGSLPNLQVLKLKDQGSGRTWETTNGEFPQLRFLQIEGTDLQHWITETCHFPRLKCLSLHFCWNLQEIPKGIGEIPTLELIEVYCSDSLARSAMQIHEDQQSYGNDTLHVRVSQSYEVRALPVLEYEGVCLRL